MDSAMNMMVSQAAGAARGSLASALSNAGGNVDKAATDFEAAFLTSMLKPIFESVETSDIYGGGAGEEAFRGLLVEEYASTISQAGGIGIADNVRAELLRMQEAMQ